MKLLIDMNLSPRWAEFLNRAGWETVHWSLVGKASATDSELMGYAAQHDQVVITYDLDFAAILAATHGHKPSVVQLRTDNLDTRVVGEKLVSALKELQHELESGALVTIDPRRTRVRLLPLKRESGSAN
jgi:predicted nuclease of predicted toxin-antitoxin system